MVSQGYFGKLFNDLKNRIGNAVPDIKWIEQDFGQLRQLRFRPAVAFPCLLIDFSPATYSGISELNQTGEITVQLRMGFNPFSSSDVVAPDGVGQKAVSYYEIEQKVFEAVQGWRTDYTQPFVRTSAVTELRDDIVDDAAEIIGLRIRVLNFATSFEDYSLDTNYVKTPATFGVEPELNQPN